MLSKTVLPEDIRKEADELAEVKATEKAMRALAHDFADDGADYKPLDLPNGLRIPDHIRISRSATFIIRENAKGENVRHFVAPAGIYVQSLARDINTGHEKWSIVWTRGKETFTLVLDRATAQNAHLLLTVAAYGLPVNSANAKRLVEFLLEFETANYTVLNANVENVSSRMGWQSTGGFLLGQQYYTKGAELVRFEPEDESTRALAKAYKTKGRIESWLNILAPAMRASKHAQLAFYAAHLPPLLKIFKCPIFVLDYAFRTSRGKTTTLRIAASVVGVPDEKQDSSAMTTWDSTPVFIERHLAAINELPFIIDDTARAKRPEDVARTLYTATQGRGRGRGKPQGIAHTGTWQTVVISSGEQPATSFTTHGGTRGRVLTVTGAPFPDGSHDLVHSLNTELLEHHGHGYALFIPWLISNREANANTWHNVYASWRDDFLAGNPDNVTARLADYIAAIHAGADLVHQAYEESGHPLPWTRTDFTDLWEGIQQEAADELGDSQALSDVLAWATANRQHFEGRNEPSLNKVEVWGKWDEDDAWQYIAIRKTVLTDFLTRAGFNPRQIFDTWKSNGYLDRPPSRRGYDSKIAISGIISWGFIKIKRAAFDKTIDQAEHES